MRAAFGVAAHFVHFIDQGIANHQTHIIGVVMDFMPAEAHDIHQEALHQPMPADIGERLALSRFGQADAAVGFVIEKAGVFQALHHTCDGGRRNVHFFSQGRRGDVGTIRLVVGDAVGFRQIFLHGVGRGHVALHLPQRQFGHPHPI